MTKIVVARTGMQLPANMDAARELLFGAIDGAHHEDKRAWRRFWKRILRLGPGEMVEVEIVFPRSSPFHRRHMAIMRAIFDGQEMFEDFEQLLTWVKVGAGLVDFHACSGVLVPIPKSISFAKADEEEFHRYHDAVMKFLRGGHAARYLWPHLSDPHAMVEAVLNEFQE